MAGIQGMLGVLCFLLFMTNCRSEQHHVTSTRRPLSTTIPSSKNGKEQTKSGLSLGAYCKHTPDDCVKHAECDASQGHVCSLSFGAYCKDTPDDCVKHAECDASQGHVCTRRTFCTVNTTILSCHFPEDTGHPLSSVALYYQDDKTKGVALPVACVLAKGMPLCDVSGGFEVRGTSLYNVTVKLPPETNGLFTCSTIPPESFTTMIPCSVSRDQHPVTSRPLSTTDPSSKNGKEHTESAHINIIIICLSCAITVLVVIVVVLAVKSLRDSGCTRGRYWPCRTTDEDGTVLGNQTNQDEGSESTDSAA